MGENESSQGKVDKTSGNLVPQQIQQGKKDLAEIRSAEEMLSKALQAIPEEQKQEIAKGG